MRFLVIILGWLLSFGVTAFPEQFSATYILTGKGMTLGEVNWSLVRSSGGIYQYNAITSPRGFASLFDNSHRSEYSKWRYANGRIQPLLYRYNRGKNKDKKKVKVVFDWKRSIAQNTAKGKTWQMPIPLNTLDKTVYVLALMRDLAKGHKNFEYTIADGGRIKTYRFSLIGEELLDTELGKAKTLKVLRTRKTTIRKTTFWCAPKFSYLPVKVAHREKDGTVLTLNISSLDGFE